MSQCILGADYMRRAGLVNRAGKVCRDLGTSVKHTKNQLRDYMEKSQPGQLGSQYHDAGIPARRAENLPCNRNCRVTSASRANTFLSLNFASEQNGSPEGQYVSFYITHKGLSDHKAT